MGRGGAGEDPLSALLGTSDAMRAVRGFAARAARVDAPVLITGETGTGKGLLARAIHRAGPRAPWPLVSVNCAGVPEGLFESEFFGHRRGAFTGAHWTHRGLFEQAHRGTLFLDEIGELTPSLQAKLLSALEEGEIRRVGDEASLSVDVRVIAATGVDLEREIREGGFRRDLYHRLAVLRCHVPPLRERGDDVVVLAAHFLTLFAGRHGSPVPSLTPEAERFLRRYPWPGNVRELAHALEAALLLCDDSALAPSHLEEALGPGRGWGPGPTPASVRYSFFGSPEEEREAILRALERCRGNKTRAARELGMARNTLRSRMRALGLE